MDLLAQSVKNLTTNEYNKFLKLLVGQQKKKDLLTAIFNCNDDEIDYYKLAEELGYKKSKVAFFTLKHRLTKDIVEYKLRYSENEIVKIESRIHELRILLYSKNHKLFEKEIKELKKKTQELEIIKGQYEIYFCDFLINYHDPNKRKLNIKKMEDVLEMEKVFHLAELEFYKAIFEYQTLFYMSKLYDNSFINSESIDKLNTYHQFLKMDVSLFFYLSVLLTFELRLGRRKEDIEDLGKYIIKLEDIYCSLKLRERFPNCNFAISCLFNKYHLANGSKTEFNESYLQLKSEVKKIAGYKTYEDVLSYYLHISLYYESVNGSLDDFFAECNRLVNKNEEALFTERFMYYYYHIYGLAHFLNSNYRKAETFLLKARQFAKFLETVNFWIQIENHVLNLTIQIKNKSDETAMYEINQLKRLTSKFKHTSPYLKDFLKFSETHVKSSIKVYFDYHQRLISVCNETGLFYLFEL
jgi:hypothetical protein